MDTISYGIEEAARTSDQSVRKSNFNNAMSFIVWTLRFLGCLPDFRTYSSPSKVLLILYSTALLGGNFFMLHNYFNYEPMDNYYKVIQNDHFKMRAHEKFYLQTAARANYMYTALIQFLYWLCAKNIYNHLNDWAKFESLYYELTNEELFPTLKKSAIIYHIITTISNILSTFAQFYIYFNSQVRPELAIIFFSLLRYTDVLFVTLMKAGELSAKRLSFLYLEEFNNSKGHMYSTNSNNLAKYEALWLKLSELIRGTGNAMAYVMFIQIIRYVVLGLIFSYVFWVRLFVLLHDAVLYILLGWAIEIVITYFCIWIITTSAYETQLQMTELIEKLTHELNENENNPKLKANFVEQVTSFQETVTVLQPKVKLLDYFSVDRHLLFVIVELYLTYLIILVQFKIAEYSIKGEKD